MISKINPSVLSKIFLPFIPKKIHRSRHETRLKAIRIEKFNNLIVKVETSKTKPKTRVRSTKQEPMIFPKAKFTCLFFKATKVNESSGKEVLIAIRVAPSRVSDMLA